MSFPQRLPFVNGDDGQWGDILVQWLKKEHYDDGTDNAVNGGHKTVTIRAGTATAGTAPLQFTSGTLLTTPEAGAIEFLTDSLYFTITTGAVRKTIAMYDDSSGALGDTYYRSSSTFTRLAGNTTSTKNFLTQTGTGSVSAIPAWGTIAAGDIPTLNQDTTGSAAKWTTARNLAGNSVDGSANVAFANKFIAQGTADSGLSAAQFLGALSTGYVKNTTTTGVLSVQAVPIPVADGGTNATSASITAFNNITGFSAASTTGTTSTNLVFSTSPALTTPNIGAATATSLTVALTNKTANYTATASDFVITCDASGGAFTITLPTAASISGRLYTIKKTDASSTTNSVTIGTTSSQTIDGATTYVIYDQYSSIDVVSNGSNWYII